MSGQMTETGCYHASPQVVVITLKVSFVLYFITASEPNKNIQPVLLVAKEKYICQFKNNH